jgi:hypothetical protein
MAWRNRASGEGVAIEREELVARLSNRVPVVLTRPIAEALDDTRAERELELKRRGVQLLLQTITRTVL